MGEHCESDSIRDLQHHKTKPGSGHPARHPSGRPSASYAHANATGVFVQGMNMVAIHVRKPFPDATRRQVAETIAFALSPLKYAPDAFDLNSEKAVDNDQRSTNLRH